MPWVEFILAFAAFFLSHSLPVRPPLKPALQARLGARGFTLAYSVLSLAMLGWLIGAAGRAPQVVLWDWAPWQNMVPLALMLPVCLIVSSTLGRPNPFSFGGTRSASFDLARPGLVRLWRHPLLLALALWAGAHLVPNGTLAHVILFGTFAAFALLGGRLIDRRKRREMGPRWQEIHQLVQRAPLICKPQNGAAFGLRLAIGGLLYVLLLLLHPWLFGVSPLI